MKNKFRFFLKRAGTWMSVKKNKACSCLLYFCFQILSLPQGVYASETDVDESAMWNLVMEYLITWIPRIGGVMLFLGAIEFAVAYKNEDANSKTNATRLMISGAMVIGIPLALANLIRI